MMYIEARSKNPGGIEGFDTPLFFEAIAQAEAQDQECEAMCGDYGGIEGCSCSECSTPLGPRELCAYCNGCGRRVKWPMADGTEYRAPVKEAQAGELSDEFVKARAMEIYPPDEVNDGHPWYGHRRTIEDTAARHMVRHLHKCGYLRPSQAIGEQTPVDEDELIRRMKNAPVVLVPSMSSEARDKAIEALENAKRNASGCTCDEAYKSRGMADPDCAACDFHEVMQFVDQALSALRGE